MDTDSIIILTVFSSFFVLLGGFIFLHGLRELGRAKKSANWPGTKGIIVHSEVEMDKSGEETMYRANISYEFAVDGITRKGRRVAYGDYGSSHPSHASRIVEKYPKGKNVTVHYMPENPGECCLDPRCKSQVHMILRGGVVFVAVGVATLFFLIRRRIFHL